MKMLETVLSNLKTSTAGDYVVTLYDVSARESVSFMVAGDQNLTKCIREYLYNESFPYDVGVRLAIVEYRNNSCKYAAIVQVSDIDALSPNEVFIVVNGDTQEFVNVVEAVKRIKNVAKVDVLDYSSPMFKKLNLSVIATHCDYIAMRRKMRNYGYVVNPKKFMEFYDRVINALYELRYRLAMRESEET